MRVVKKHYWLYVLKLEQDKYYVGITTKTPEQRFQQHVNGIAGAAWTRRYKPLSIIDRKDLGLTNVRRAEAYENRVVRKYIKKYGVDNVRGGDISTPEDLVVRFGWLITKEGWQGIAGIAFLLLCLFIMYGLYLTKK